MLRRQMAQNANDRRHFGQFVHGDAMLFGGLRVAMATIVRQAADENAIDDHRRKARSGNGRT